MASSRLSNSVISSDILKTFGKTSKALQNMTKVDPRERYVLLYPDSDKAHVGMAFNLLNCKPAEEVFEKASEIIKKNLLKICLEGPKSDLLESMENRQLATFVTSHATVEKLAHERPGTIDLCKTSGGVGVGFVNSLVFGRAMSFENGLELVQKQGRALDLVSKEIASARIKVRLSPATQKSRVCRAAVEQCLRLGLPEDLAVCSVTKHIHSHVIEISGHEEAIKYLETEGVELFNFRWMSRVKNVPHAYQTRLMLPVKEYLRGYFEEKIRLNPSYIVEPDRCSVYSTTAGHRLRLPKTIINDLKEYPVRPVKVEQLLARLYSRPRGVPYPNTLVVWDKFLLQTLLIANRKAWSSAKLLT